MLRALFSGAATATMLIDILKPFNCNISAVSGERCPDDAKHARRIDIQSEVQLSFAIVLRTFISKTTEDLKAALAHLKHHSAEHPLFP